MSLPACHEGVPDLPAQDLPDEGTGKFVEHHHAARHLVGGQVLPSKGQQRIRIHGGSRSWHDRGHHILAAAWPGQPDHGDLREPREVGKDVFDFTG